MPSCSSEPATPILRPPKAIEGSTSRLTTVEKTSIPVDRVSPILFAENHHNSSPLVIAACNGGASTSPPTKKNSLTGLKSTQALASGKPSRHDVVPALSYQLVVTVQDDEKSVSDQVFPMETMEEV
ncbi:OLC1v1036988C1 [Oldenlandia corymbosa var. corymbosa]|uniref:OLC1v1036988C1 n=1 Tax=Oldenlandia corymbosa var. corymbosa TaxID=529605 RepID=A0AAV1CXI1_OLDCO|nr:OLC1v1036988C1 [Oldenlandia corymbosa var. corymbosa]